MSDKDLTPEDWMARGYKRFDGDYLKNASFLLQKRITDDIGTKYFINVYAYDWKNFTAVKKDWGFQPEIQLTAGENRDKTVIVSLIGFDIDGVEEHFENLWIIYGKPYYERNGE
jgi:hypothetical protein